jgi:hypothetical protein
MAPVDHRKVQLGIIRMMERIRIDKGFVEVILKFEAGNLTHFQEVKKGMVKDLLDEEGGK